MVNVALPSHVMLNVVLPSVVNLNVATLIVVAPTDHNSNSRFFEPELAWGQCYGWDLQIFI
jgi:hypothetical protein